jgi:transposase-like protein
MAPRNRNDFRISGGSDSSYTRAQFRQEFPDDATCLEWLMSRTYPNGVHCPICDKITPHYRVKSRPSYSCQFCGHHVHPMQGTIFEKSSTNLVLWFEAIFIMSSTRCGISAKQLEREIGVTYKTAWRMFRLIRSMLAESDGTKLSGKVEVDETYFVRSRRTRPKVARGKKGFSPGKQTVFGMVEREGRVIAKHIAGPSAKELQGNIREFILPGSLVFTDEAPSYKKLRGKGYRHRRINHSQKVYVRGDTHTNTVESFWGLLKNNLQGVYHSVSAKHLQLYIDEVAFRYNRRSKGYPMFRDVLERASSPLR